MHGVRQLWLRFLTRESKRFLYVARESLRIEQQVAVEHVWLEHVPWTLHALAKDLTALGMDKLQGTMCGPRIDRGMAHIEGSQDWPREPAVWEAFGEYLEQARATW